MTINRIATLPAETGTEVDFIDMQSGGFQGVSTSSDDVRTGTRGFTLTGSTNVQLVPCGGVSAIRMGYWFRLRWMDNRSPIFWAGRGQSYTDNQRLFLYYYADENKLLLGRQGSTSSPILVSLKEIPAPHVFQPSMQKWMHFGFTYKAHVTEGFFSFYIDGIRVFDYQGDTLMGGIAQQNGGIEYTDIINFAGGPGRDWFIGNGFLQTAMDDFYVDSYEGEVDAVVPAKRFVMTLPAANGSSSNFAPHNAASNWQAVSTNPNNGDTNYNISNDPDDVDTFTGTTFALLDEYRVVACNPFAFSRRTNVSGTPRLRVLMNDGVNQSESADHVLTMGYSRHLLGHFPQTPSALDWTEALVNSVQFGYKLTGTTA